MAGITLVQAEAKLALWMAAEDAAASNKSYRIADRELTRQDLAEIRESIKYWQGWVTQLGSPSLGRPRTRYAVIG